MGDQRRRIHLAGREKIDRQREITAPVDETVAVGADEAQFSADHLAQRRARRHHVGADQRDSPPTARHFDCQINRLGAPDALQHDIDGFLAGALYSRFGGIALPQADHLPDAHLLGGSRLMRVLGRQKDAPRAQRLCRRGGQESDRSRTEDHHGIAAHQRGAPQAMDRHSERLHQRAIALRRTLWQRQQATRRRDHLIGEAAIAVPRDELVARADVILPRAARPALAARDERLQRDGSAHLQMRDALAHRLDRAGDLMPRHDRRLRPAVLERMQVAAAHAAGAHAHDRLAWSRNARRRLFQADLPFSVVERSSTHQITLPRIVFDTPHSNPARVPGYGQATGTLIRVSACGSRGLPPQAGGST